MRAQQAQPEASSPAPATTTEQKTTPRSSAESDDLSITANVTARELRFDVVPAPKVEFKGKPERNTTWEAERQNLPRPVEPGVTYRNIGIQLKITSVFADIDRIVAEALGEVPVSDDASPQHPAPPQQQEQQESAPTTPPPSSPNQTESGRRPL
ncbi:MAG TPA: hypothetical protein VE842_20630 [Pyrinomonadaceae bacterium]|nr:hypothetical protein [Pyrinomonadaceae bacterium]